MTVYVHLTTALAAADTNVHRWLYLNGPNYLSISVTMVEIVHPSGGAATPELDPSKSTLVDLLLPLSYNCLKCSSGCCFRAVAIGRD